MDGAPSSISTSSVRRCREESRTEKSVGYGCTHCVFGAPISQSPGVLTPEDDRDDPKLGLFVVSGPDANVQR